LRRAKPSRNAKFIPSLKQGAFFGPFVKLSKCHLTLPAYTQAYSFFMNWRAGNAGG
jgi:hypothetical protein